jgi:uncharacterized protein (TIGR03118 family)
MSPTRLHPAVTAFVGAAFLGVATAGTGDGYLVPALSASALNAADDDVVVQVTDLVANVPILVDRFGIVHHPFVLDPNLVNPWGMTEAPASPFWIADNGRGVSTLYNVPGAANTAVSVNPLVVSIPGPLDPLGSTGAPTGAVFNTGAAARQFTITGVDRNGIAASAPAIFLFATEDGTIVGWNPGINPPGFDLSKAGTYGIVAVNNSENPSAAGGAVYKGLAIATDAVGNTFLYATNFRAGTVEVYDGAFHRVPLTPDAFTDRHLPHRYAPFNVVLSGDRLFVTYARQDAAKHDDVAGHGRGIVNTFDLSGHALVRFAQHGRLNSPWGLVQAPASFGQFAGAVLIGNFGDGRIHAFDPGTGKLLGKVVNSVGQEILIDGLWSLIIGNGRGGGAANAIYFTAGPNGEKDGLFGSLVPVALGTPCGVPCR